MTNSNTLKRFIRESLLSERVFGAQAFVYHGSKTPPDKFIDVLLNDELQPGSAEGSMYGKGLYTVYDLKGTKTGAGKYGRYIYKLKINLYGFIIFDPEVATKVYGKPLSPAEQAQLIGKSQLAKKLEEYDPEMNTFTSEGALWASKFLAGKVKGLIYTGSRDGRCALIYDPTVAVPTSWKKFNDSNWEIIDRQRLKSAIGKSVTDAWEEDKYNIPEVLKKVMKLPPDERIISGNLDLSNSPITSLPSDLKIEGDLDLSFTNIASLPRGLEVGGSLSCTSAPITSLPVDLQVGENLNLRNTRITSLPAGLQVNGDLILKETAIETLPVDLNVKGNINLDDSHIISLPAGIQINGSLLLRHSSIRSLPDGLYVRGDLALLGANLITSLPANLKVGGYLGLQFTNISSLPSGLQVGHMLSLDGTYITKLPKDLKVRGPILPKNFQRMYDEM